MSRFYHLKGHFTSPYVFGMSGILATREMWPNRALSHSLCTVISLMFSLKFIFVCFFPPLLLQYFTGLECGHKFCMQCWSEYLTTKIMEEGMGQVNMPIFCFSGFSEFPIVFRPLLRFNRWNSLYYKSLWEYFSRSNF